MIFDNNFLYYVDLLAFCTLYYLLWRICCEKKMKKIWVIFVWFIVKIIIIFRYLLVDGYETCLLANECPDIIRYQLRQAHKNHLFAYKRHEAKIAWPKAAINSCRAWFYHFDLQIIHFINAFSNHSIHKFKMSMLKTWLLNNKTVQLIYFMRNFSNNHLTNS